ncbi:ATP-binding cassette domain-containing protein [Streptomyces sp. NPDC049813]|uniref:ATP-binding cassette domain-containing protein n=1 Tax=Streptomyces sp. NPDC049813 TaxID=3365597 RepID=UPI0037B4390F
MRQTISAEGAPPAAPAGGPAGRTPRPAAPQAPAISAEGLVKRFGEHTAVDGVDLAVPHGSVVGLLGPNGSGKTTTTRMLTTLLAPDAGRVVIDGIDAVKYPQRVRPLIGMAGQYAAVDPNLTGRENLVMVGRLTGMGRADVRARAGQLLEQFRLTEIADRPSRTYSGGQRRRFDLAAALVHRPRILFFDEPTTGLDPRSRRDLWAVLEQLVADGTTVLLTTQYLEEADHLADHLVVLDRGRVIAQGTPAQLKADLGASVAEARFADEAQAARAATALGSAHRAVRHGDRIEIPVGAESDSAMNVLGALQHAGLSPVGFVLREPSLDDVFLSLTGRASTEAPDSKEAA